MSFITDNSQLPFPKQDREPLGPHRNPVEHITSSEWNKTCQSIIDVRAWFLSGSYYGFKAQSSMPNVQMGLSGTDAAFWVSSSLRPYFTTTSSSGLLTYDLFSPSTASLDFLTRDITVQRNAYVSGTVSVSGTLMVSGGLVVTGSYIYRNRVAGSDIVQYTLLKAGPGDSQVQQFTTADNARYAIATSLDGVVSGSTVRSVEVIGQQAPIKSDGTTAIAVGDALEPSVFLNGRVMKYSSGTPIGIAMSSLSSGSVDGLVEML